MAKFYENFNGATVGSGHPDFSVLWGNLGISVESTSILAGSNAHMLLSHVSGTYARNAAQWSKATTSGKTVVRALVEFQNHDSGVPGSISGPFLSGTGTTSARTGYVQWFRRSHAISRYDSGAETSTEITGAFPLGEQGAVVQRYVEILRDGSLVEVREWPLAGTRPSVADVSLTDASPLPVAGAVGLSHLSNSSASSPNMRVYEIAAATDGSTLPDGPVDPNAIDIANINTDNRLVPGAAATITGTNLINTTGVTVGGEAQTNVTVVSDTEVTFTVVRGGNPYDQDLTAELTSTDGVASITVQQAPESGQFSVTASDPETTDPDSLWTGLVDTTTGNPITIVFGDQALVKNPNNLTNLAITPRGSISADQTGTFVVQIRIASEGVWGGDQTVTFTDGTAVADTTPDPFTVAPLTDQPTLQYVEFSPITVSGMDAGAEAAVTVSGVEYAVDAGPGYAAFTTTSTNVQNGYIVKPRMMTSSAFSTETTGSIFIGSQSSSLSATTIAEPALPSISATLVADSNDSPLAGNVNVSVRVFDTNNALVGTGTIAVTTNGVISITDGSLVLQSGKNIVSGSTYRVDFQEVGGSRQRTVEIAAV